ncbi:unnamed protein product [Blepharisma stoltei]|uniref:Guanylate cyclase domain-containing protein n=1 Tax=Blepharisma stoltei TaxID=1481888 RepID=A0AAU9IWU5_9CILI|nr:unnamed protein product [Blepharisma stoltei]
MQNNTETNWREFKVDGNSSIKDSIFPKNLAKSTRYTLLSILPKNLFEQFQRSSNLWFLIVSIFQLIPINLNPTDSWSTIAPLALLLFFTFIKDALNDFRRWKDDQKINSMLYSCWNGERFEKIKSKDLLVGNIVLLRDGEIVPADMVLLSSESDNQNAYLDITSIIGSANFKEVKGISEIQRFLNSAEGDAILKKFQGRVKMEEPNNDFSKFKGRIKLTGFPKAFEINAEQALFRGGKLSGTSWVTGLVVYTGHETKTLMNTKRPEKKTSLLEKRINKWVGIILLVLIGLVIFSICTYYYLSVSNYSSVTLPEAFVSFILLYNNIIPISLFVTMDLIRILQVMCIQRNMKHTVHFKTGDVNEDLGQIEYILLDKSRTITENDYYVQLCIIDSDVYIRSDSPDSSLASDEDGPLCKQAIGNNILSTERVTFNTPKEHSLTFCNLRLELLNNNDEKKLQFAKCMALCNSVTPSRDKIIGPTADEKALVNLASELGVNLVVKAQKACQIDINGCQETFNILGSRPFQPISKKTRLLVKGKPEDPAILYIKGSYDTIIPLLDDEELQASLLYESKKLSSEGIRPVLLAYKILTDSQTKDFLTKLELAKYSPVNMNHKYEAAYSEFEKNPTFLGVAGIRDKVLPETLECVEALKKGGIKLWLVSGDSEECTLEAAYSTKLLTSRLPLVQIKQATSVYGVTKILQRAIGTHIYHESSRNRSKTIVYRKPEAPKIVNEIFDNDAEAQIAASESIVSEFLEEASIIKDEIQAKGAHLAYQSLMAMNNSRSLYDAFLSRSFSPKTVSFAISIDRKSFEFALSDEDSRKLLVCLLVASKCALFSDMLPKDKSNLVKLLKENLSFKPTVLAVGEGNSNISMIQEADIGIGIQDKEHNHASNFCEISICHFSVLNELILLHGYRNYSRMSRIILLFFYKNFVLIAITFGYIFMSDYSGATIYNSGLLVGYNLLYTTFPLISLATFDVNVDKQRLLETPQLYIQGILNKLFSWRTLMYYSFLSIVQAGVLLLLISYAFHSAINENGYAEDDALFGTTLYIATVLTVLAQMWIDCYTNNMPLYVSYIRSITLLIIYVVVSNFTPFPDYEQLGVGTEISKFPISLIAFLITPFVAVVPSYLIKAHIFLFRHNSKEMIIVAAQSIEDPELNRLEDFADGLRGMYRVSSIWKSIHGKSQFDMNWALRFVSGSMEKLYREHYIKEHILMFRLANFVIWVILILWTVYELVAVDTSVSYTVIRIILVLGYSAVLVIVMFDFFRKHYVIITLIIISIAIAAIVAADIVYYKLGLVPTAMVPTISYILFNVDFEYITILNIINVLLFLISLLFYYLGSSEYNRTEETLLLLTALLLVVAITATSGFIGYFLDKSKRQEHKLINIAKNGVEKIQTILGYLLPAFVRNRVKKGIRYIAEDQGTVTILFCDIYDFDKICKEYSPIELTTFLDEIFQKFDQICDTVGVAKIETVGKTYMACAGLKDSELEMSKQLREVTHARRCIEMGLAIIREIQSVKLKYGSTLQVKIGINSGPVIAGVVGYHKPQFSLVGDTVNTASRMCSTLEQTNTIQISNETYELLESFDGLKFIPNQVEAKGKGIMNTFLLSEINEGNIDYDPSQLMDTVLLNPISQVLQAETSALQEEEEESPEPKKTRKYTRFDIDNRKDVFKKNDPEIIKPVNLFDFSLKESENQRLFRIQHMEANYVTVLLGLIAAFITYGLLLVISVLEEEYLHDYSDKDTIIMRSTVVGALFILIIIHLTKNKYRFYQLGAVPVLLLMLATDIYLNFRLKKINGDYISLEIMYILVILNHASNLSVRMVIFVSLGIFIPWVVSVSSNAEDVANAILVFGFAIINTFAAYSREQRVRINFNLQHLAEREIEETDKLLVQMMPPHVLENMKQDKSITDKLQDVTLLFADIVGFTAWSSNKGPKQIVKMLSELFTQFDKKCVELNVYKVHTIGDCYVVMGYNGSVNRDIGQECLNMLKMAQSMIEIINAMNKLHGSELNMRIGLHTGTVIAGVIGTNIVRYDIYGPDVLITNKMESNGKPGDINVSDVTKTLLERNAEGLYEFTFNKEVAAKSIDRVHQSYFIKPKPPA